MNTLRSAALSLSFLLMADAARAADSPPGHVDIDQPSSLGSLLIGFGVTTALVSYGLNVAVSLTSGRDCVGPKCDERYFSFIPLVGGVVQFAYAGTAFHRRWHGPMCLPLTIASVAGQALGLAAVVAGLIARAGGRRARRSAVARALSGPLHVGGSLGPGGARVSLVARF